MTQTLRIYQLDGYSSYDTCKQEKKKQKAADGSGENQTSTAQTDREERRIYNK